MRSCLKTSALLAIGSSVLTLHLADADHVVRIPELTSLDLGCLMLRIARPGVNGLEILPVDRRYPGAIGVSRPFDAEKACKGSCVLDQARRQRGVLGVIYRCIDGREDNRVVGRLGRGCDVRHRLSWHNDRYFFLPSFFSMKSARF